MRSSIRRLQPLLPILLLGWFLTTGPVAAQDAPLGEIELPPSSIVVDLADATVRIDADDDAEPVLRWWRQRAEEPGSDQLEVTQTGMGVAIERPAQPEGGALARLVIEIVMPTGHSIAVFGSDLDLTIDRQIEEEPERSNLDRPDLDTETVAGDPALVELQLVSSEANLVGVGPVTGTFDGSVAEFRRTTGQHELAAFDSQIRITEHLGPLTVVGVGSDITAEETMGRLFVKATGGSVQLRSTKGQFKLEASDAYFQVLNSRGSGTISVNNSNLDMRTATLQSLNVKGVSGHVTMASVAAAVTVDFTGGSLIADAITGDVNGTLREGARLELTDLHGQVKLNVQSDSAAHLRAIRGDVQLSARGADLTVDEAKTLTLVATESWVTITGITKLASFNVTRSEVDLDLAQCRDRNLELNVKADSHVQVRLNTPCRVKTKGLGSSLASQVDVTGCELQLGQSNRSATKRVRGVDGNRPVTLNAKVAESSRLTVVGRP